MKKIYVIRHANANYETRELTVEGRERAARLKHAFGKFDLVITSDRPRVKDTALLLSGIAPQIDERAGFVYTLPEQKERLRTLAKIHPMNHAGVIFVEPEFKELVEIIGKNLIELIKETFTKLPEDGKALIVSQDGVMLAAERILKKTPDGELENYYKPLEGFIINEDLVFEDIIS